jgi:hypothetical protein
VSGQLLAKKRKVVLLEGGGCKGSFGIEEAGELSDGSFALERRDKSV